MLTTIVGAGLGIECVYVSDQVCVDGVQAADSPVHFRKGRSGSIAAHCHIVAFHHQHAAVAHTDLW